MTSTAPALENLTLNITHEIEIRASIEDTFAALLEQVGPGNETPDGMAMPLKLEPYPGGRWFRDLGDNAGHLWGFVQAIKRPTLLEFTGPLFMSYPAINNVQYRLSEAAGGTLLTFRHSAMGFIPDQHREGLGRGWTPLLERIQKQAEGNK